MADVSTFIKLDRNILRWRWYQNSNTFRVFLHCLIEANFRDNDFENITIHRGEFATTYKKIAISLGMTLQEVRTALTHLKSTSELTVKIYPKFQVITVLNYDKYQSDLTAESTVEQQASNRQATGKQQQSKKEKKLKKLSNYNNINNINNTSITYNDIERVQKCEHISTQEKVPKKEKLDYEAFKEIYNEHCRELSRVTVISEKRKKAIRDFLKQLTIDDFRQACIKAGESDFCKGENERGWRADFDFIIRVDKALSIIEGKYKNNKKQQSGNRFLDMLKQMGDEE